MNKTLTAICNKIKQQFAQDIVAIDSALGETVIKINPKVLSSLMLYIRDEHDMEFKQLIDICGVDFPAKEQRFEIVYNVLSYRKNCRLRFKISIDEGYIVPSIAKVYNCANWYEREIWDMFGIKFTDHDNSTRILTDYNFSGHPLRKDFPLVGYVEPHYSTTKQQVVYDKVKLPQEYRDFDFLSPWDGNNKQKIDLPGDEKAFVDNHE